MPDHQPVQESLALEGGAYAQLTLDHREQAPMPALRVETAECTVTLHLSGEDVQRLGELFLNTYSAAPQVRGS